MFSTMKECGIKEFLLKTTHLYTFPRTLTEVLNLGYRAVGCLREQDEEGEGEWLIFRLGPSAEPLGSEQDASASEKLAPFKRNVAYRNGRYTCVYDWLSVEEAVQIFNAMTEHGVKEFLLESAPSHVYFAEIMAMAIKLGYEVVGSLEEQEPDEFLEWFVLRR